MCVQGCGYFFFFVIMVWGLVYVCTGVLGCLLFYGFESGS